MKITKITKVYVKNKKAYHDYEFLEDYEAGIVLTGAEVKSIIESRANLRGSWVTINNGEVFLKNFHISKYENIGYIKHDESRDKKLLLHKREIKKLIQKLQVKGITLIVTEIYKKEGSKKIKAKLRVAKGKKKHDKRETLKRKQQEMDAKRALKEFKNY